MFLGRVASFFFNLSFRVPVLSASSYQADAVTPTRLPAVYSDAMEPLNATELTGKITTTSAPVLIWLSPEHEERIELSGPVARRWIAKTDNFLGSELPYGGDQLAVFLPNHWRTPFWLIAPWLRGMQLVSPDRACDTDLVVSNDLGFLQAVQDEGGPDALVAQELDSMSLAWQGDLPASFLDATADVMTFGDFVDDPKDAPSDHHLVDESVDWAAPNLWEDTEEQTLPISSLRGFDYLGDVKDLATGKILERDQLPEELDGARILVRTNNPVLFSAQLIQLWMAGAQVLWVPEDIAQERIDQEVPALELVP